MGDRSTLENAVQEIFAARNSGDIKAVMALLHPACIFRIAGSDRAGSLAQKAQAPETLQAALEVLIANWDLSGLNTVSLHIDGETVFAHRIGQVRFIPSDAVLNTELLDKITYRNGLIIEYVQFVDTLAIADIAGLPKA